MFLKTPLKISRQALFYGLISGLLLACSDSPTTPTGNVNNCTDIINAGMIPPNLANYDQASRDIFSTYLSNYPAGAAVAARYVVSNGSGDGSSYSNAAGNVKTILDGITNASANKVYVILVAPGTYIAGAEINMKNNVAIVGGGTCLETGADATVLSGGGTRRVFSNSGIANTAVLYGVTITDGYTTEKGGGMVNHSSSPLLTGVIFSGNTAYEGGGMYNTNSSPLLTRVTLSGNTATNGGGMYNNNSSPLLTEVTLFENRSTNLGGGMRNSSSSPVLNRVTFSGNTSDRGGGMHNYNSSPLLTGVILSGNKATYGGGIFNNGGDPILTRVTFSGNTSKGGGGMYNQYSSPILTGVTLSGNISTNGGGMYNDSSSLLLTGVTLSGNTAANGGGIYNNNTFPILINTILWGNSTEIFGTESSIHYSIMAGVTNSVDPGLLPLTNNGGGILTHAIPANSSAANKGLYVKRSAAPTGRGCLYRGENRCNTYTLYYSIDNSKWYSNPELTTTVTPPATAVNLTAADATGRNRSGRPDIGAYEARQ